MSDWHFFEYAQPEPLRALHILIEMQTVYDGGPMLGAYVEWAVKLTNGKYVIWVNNQPEYLNEVPFTEETDDGLKFVSWRYFPDEMISSQGRKKIMDAELWKGGG